MLTHHIFYLQKSLEIIKTMFYLRKECSRDCVLSYVECPIFIKVEMIEKVVFRCVLDQPWRLSLFLPVFRSRARAGNCTHVHGLTLSTLKNTCHLIIAPNRIKYEVLSYNVWERWFCSCAFIDLPLCPFNSGDQDLMGLGKQRQADGDINNKWAFWGCPKSRGALWRNTG